MTTTASAEETWAPDWTLRILLNWTAVTTVIFWLPTIRGAFEGAAYSWSLLVFHGRGTMGDYWLTVLNAGFALFVQWLGWRGARRPFHAILVAWHSLLALTAIRFAWSNPEDFRFRGDTLGIDISLAWIGPILFGIPALLAVRWSWRDLRSSRSREVSPWGRRNTVWASVLLAMLPLQYYLLHFGSPQSRYDQLGVWLTIAQWLFVGFALRPR